MPVTRSRNGAHEMFSTDQGNSLSIDQTNTTRFLFGEEEGATSTDIKSYLRDDTFPTLVTNKDYPNMVGFPCSFRLS